MTALPGSRGYVHYFLVAVGIVWTLLAGCAGVRRGGIMGPAVVPRFVVPPDSLFYYKGFGDLALSYEGERYRANIDVVSKAGDAFEGSIFGPFGGLIVWLSAGPDSVRIEAGELVRQIARNDSLKAGIALLRGYPFTFNEFARILTGRLYRPALTAEEPDSIVEE
ncbi:MAG: hypothetical protein GF344_11355, partial [Chitinivibrionales bacterium]|nr:hypothetical protein [Chitinivibrionales bacterium]MBD3357397.1 hypothetical protein [Chitinivibrionales bacterium]